MQNNNYFRFLGTAGTYPSKKRNVSGIFFSLFDKKFLIDCGEGTQKQLFKYDETLFVDFILITHLHTDHYLGIFGLIATLNLFKRIKPLIIYGNKLILRIPEFLRLLNLNLSFKIIYSITDPFEKINFKEFYIESLKAKHSILSYSYYIKIKDTRKVLVEKIKALNIPLGPLYGKIQKGLLKEYNGVPINYNDVLGPLVKNPTIFVSGDTTCFKCDYKKNVDFLIHEATFLMSEKLEAKARKHSIMENVIKLSKVLNCKKTYLVHISQRYNFLIEKIKIKLPKNINIPNDGDKVYVMDRTSE